MVAPCYWRWLLALGWVSRGAATSARSKRASWTARGSRAPRAIGAYGRLALRTSQSLSRPTAIRN